MDDLISRQAAIDELIAMREHIDASMSVIGCMAYEMAIEALRQPERKEGHWIRKSTWMWTCSCCGKDNAYAYAADDAYEPTVLQDFFCPNCGAKMMEE